MIPYLEALGGLMVWRVGTKVHSELLRLKYFNDYIFKI